MNNSICDRRRLPANSWSRTVRGTEIVTHSWTVEHFTYLNERTDSVIESPEFQLGANPDLWKLRLKPWSEEAWMSLHLHVRRGSRGTCKDLVYVPHALSILAGNGKPCYVKRFRDDVQPWRSCAAKCTSWGTRHFIPREMLSSNPSLLPSGSLTIFCEIAVVRSRQIQGDFNQVGQPSGSPMDKSMLELNTAGGLKSTLLKPLTPSAPSSPPKQQADGFKTATEVCRTSTEVSRSSREPSECGVKPPGSTLAHKNKRNRSVAVSKPWMVPDKSRASRDPIVMSCFDVKSPTRITALVPAPIPRRGKSRGVLSVLPPRNAGSNENMGGAVLGRVRIRDSSLERKHRPTAPRNGSRSYQKLPAMSKKMRATLRELCRHE